MSLFAKHLACALDPVQLARRVGMEPEGWQLDALRSAHPRQLYNIHRQGGKSQVAAVKATHTAVYEPGSLCLCLSPSLRQSGELFKKVMATYRALGRPVPSDAESATTLVLENGSRVVSLPSSESTIRAYSAVRLLICDEASRIPDTVLAAVRPMLAVSHGQLIALSTPAGARGWWHDAWANGGATWERYAAKAEDCPRISAEFLAEERRALGPFFFAQEYECSFLSAETAAFDATWIDQIKECEPWTF